MLFTDEADAVRAEEVVPVGPVDEPCTVFSLIVAVGPVVRLARFPLPGTKPPEKNTLEIVTTIIHWLVNRLSWREPSSRPGEGTHVKTGRVPSTHFQTFSVSLSVKPIQKKPLPAICFFIQSCKEQTRLMKSLIGHKTPLKSTNLNYSIVWILIWYDFY